MGIDWKARLDRLAEHLHDEGFSRHESPMVDLREVAGEIDRLGRKIDEFVCVSDDARHSLGRMLGIPPGQCGSIVVLTRAVGAEIARLKAEAARLKAEVDALREALAEVVSIVDHVTDQCRELLAANTELSPPVVGDSPC